MSRLPGSLVVVQFDKLSKGTVMKILLTIDSKCSVEIHHSDVAGITSWLADEERNAAFFSRLSKHPASEVRASVASMNSMPLTRLRRLACDQSIEVVRQVANNDQALETFDISLIKEMIERDVSVAADIADNLSLVHEQIQDEVIDLLMSHDDPRVYEAADRFRLSR